MTMNSKDSYTQKEGVKTLFYYAHYSPFMVRIILTIFMPKSRAFFCAFLCLKVLFRFQKNRSFLKKVAKKR